MVKNTITKISTKWLWDNIHNLNKNFFDVISGINRKDNDSTFSQHKFSYFSIILISLNIVYMHCALYTCTTRYSQFVNSSHCTTRFFGTAIANAKCKIEHATDKKRYFPVNKKVKKDIIRQENPRNFEWHKETFYFWPIASEVYHKGILLVWWRLQNFLPLFLGLHPRLISQSVKIFFKLTYFENKYILPTNSPNSLKIS